MIRHQRDCACNRCSTFPSCRSCTWLEPASTARSKCFSGSRTTQVLPSCSIDATAASSRNTALTMARPNLKKFRTHTTSSESCSARNVPSICGSLQAPTFFAALDAKHESASKPMPVMQVLHGKARVPTSARRGAKNYGDGGGERSSSRCLCAVHTAKT